MFRSARCIGQGIFANGANTLSGPVGLNFCACSKLLKHHMAIGIAQEDLLSLCVSELRTTKCVALNASHLHETKNMWLMCN